MESNLMLVRKQGIVVSMIISGLLSGCGSDSKTKSVEPDVIQPAELTAAQVRDHISTQVGGLQNLKVPATNEEIPLPVVPDSKKEYIQTTEAKRYLGKQLFHDPVRTVRLDPSLGGVEAAKQTGSCGSCHFGAVGSKAGTQINFNVGGEGLGYWDEKGDFTPRRRARIDILTQIRTEPLYDNDQLVDQLPTLTDVFENEDGMRTVGLPSIMGLPNVGTLRQSGRFDAVDSVGRNAPSVVGSAFNNRLLGGGLAGESQGLGFAINPFADPAQENITLLLLDAHRMLEAQSAELQKIPGYIHLFREAFPTEAAMADAAQAEGDEDYLNLLINDVTVFRATATFMRTVVTRNTPWDKFLSGDDDALTPAQLRGAKLFFTSAENDKGGAGCMTCHSGPMLNKQSSDPDVAGVGYFVEENFFNIGLSDHPLQTLNAQLRNDPDYRDEGRMEVTDRVADAHKFRTPTLRQIKDSRVFFHNGKFTSLKSVIEYFNDGVPEDPITGTASTLSSIFTHPRGTGKEAGLGLNDDEMNDLVAFLSDALHDQNFITYDPTSTTDTFQLNEQDYTYSKYRPALANMGVTDGFVISGMAENNNDPLTRRDRGMEFLDVTDNADISTQSNTIDATQTDTLKITNTSNNVIDTHLLLIIEGLPDSVQLENAFGKTEDDEFPYLRLYLENGVIEPSSSISTKLIFKDNRDASAQATVNYNVILKSGQGNP